jgi:hypothetical protein
VTSHDPHLMHALGVHEARRESAERKAGNIIATGAVVLSNPGCEFQIAAELRRRGAKAQVLQLADSWRIRSRLKGKSERRWRRGSLSCGVCPLRQDENEKTEEDAARSSFQAASFCR